MKTLLLHLMLLISLTANFTALKKIKELESIISPEKTANFMPLHVFGFFLYFLYAFIIGYICSLTYRGKLNSNS